MRLTTTTAVAATLAAGLLATVPAGAGARAKARPCAEQHAKPRKDHLCAAGSPLAARFRIAAAVIDGTISVRQRSAEQAFSAEGTSRYRLAAAPSGKPFRIAAPITVAGAGPVTWTASTRATYTDDRGSEDCSRTAAPSAAPAQLGGAFTPTPDGRSVTVQWQLVNEGWSCPAGIVDIGPLPAETQTMTYKSARFAGATVKLPIEIDHRWRPDDSTEARVTWKGTVTLRRAR